jgi:hypothetical protein
MGYGKSKESASQERKNLIGINPIANRASGGSFMSKHSIHSQGGNSPVHQAFTDSPTTIDVKETERRKKKTELADNERNYMGGLTQDQSKGNFFQKTASSLRNFGSDVLGSKLTARPSSGKKMF